MASSGAPKKTEGDRGGGGCGGVFWRGPSGAETYSGTEILSALIMVVVSCPRIGGVAMYL